MKLAGFNFSKISIEKNKEVVEKIKISSNIEILDIKQVNLNTLNKENKFVNISFSYNLDYEPSFAKIDFKGSLVLVIEEKMTEEIINSWKEKKISNDFKLAVLNIVFKKCNLKALQLEDEMNLPLHLSLGSLKTEKKE